MTSLQVVTSPFSKSPQATLIKGMDTFAHGNVRYILHKPIKPNPLPIVFIHGIEAYHYYFNPLARHLFELNYTTLQFDLYGRGKSDNPNVAHTPDLFVTQIFELVKKLLPTQECIVIAHSMGGCIACHFTAKYPLWVKKLVLLSPAGMHWSLPKAASLMKIPILNSILFDAVKMTPEQMGETSYFHWNVQDPSCAWFIKKHTKKYHMTKFNSSFVNSLKHFPLQGLKEAKVADQLTTTKDRPTLLLWGEFDVTIPGDECFDQWITALGPNAVCGVVQQTRHQFFTERIDEVNHMVSEFLKQDMVSLQSIVANLNKPLPALPTTLHERDAKLHSYWQTKHANLLV